MAATPSVFVIDRAEGATSVLDPLRMRILEELAEPDSASGLARRLGLPRQQLNYHLRQLEAEGLVEMVGEGRKRNFVERLHRAVAQTYLINPATLGRLALDPDRVGDRLSSEYLLAVASQMVRDVAALQASAAASQKRLATLTMESEVRFVSSEAQEEFARELTDTVASLIAKYHDEGASDGRRFRFVCAAHPVRSVAALVAGVDAEPGGGRHEHAAKPDQRDRRAAREPRRGQRGGGCTGRRRRRGIPGGGSDDRDRGAP